MSSGTGVGQSNAPSSVENAPGSAVTLGPSGSGGERDGDIQEQVAGIQAELARIRSLQRRQESRLSGEVDTPPVYDGSGR